MTNIVINKRKITASALIRKWPGVVVACKFNKATGGTLIEWDETAIPVVSSAEIVDAQDVHESAPPLTKSERAASEYNNSLAPLIVEAVLEEMEAKSRLLTTADKPGIDARAKAKLAEKMK